MSFKDLLMEDMKTAMKARDADRLGVIRFLMSQIKNVEIDKGEQTDEQMKDIVRKQIKQMKEAVADYERGGRTDLVEAETKKIEVLQAYLPAMMSSEELSAVVDTVLAANPGIQMGPAIGAVKQATQGKAESSEIATLVKQKLTA